MIVISAAEPITVLAVNMMDDGQSSSWGNTTAVYGPSTPSAGAVLLPDPKLTIPGAPHIYPPCPVTRPSLAYPPRRTSRPGLDSRGKARRYRLIVQREGKPVRLFTRGGRDWTDRYPQIVESALTKRSTSFVIDGEAVLLGVDGISDLKQNGESLSAA